MAVSASTSGSAGGGRTAVTRPTDDMGATNVRPVSTRASNFAFGRAVLQMGSPIGSLRFCANILNVALLTMGGFPSVRFSLCFLTGLASDRHRGLPTNRSLRVFTFHRHNVLRLARGCNARAGSSFDCRSNGDRPRNFKRVYFDIPGLSRTIT